MALSNEEQIILAIKARFDQLCVTQSYHKGIEFLDEIDNTTEVLFQKVVAEARTNRDSL